MDYMELVQVCPGLILLYFSTCFSFELADSSIYAIHGLQKHVDDNADITLSCAPVGERYIDCTIFQKLDNIISICPQKMQSILIWFSLLW